MRFTIGGVLSDALATFRANADVLIRVIAPFVFLPAYAIQLLVPPPPMRGAGTDGQTTIAWFEKFELWASANGGWYLANFAVATFGMLVVVILLVGAGRPTVGEAMRRAVGPLYLRYLLAMILVSFVTSLGILCFILPGLFVAGRALCTGPAIVEEPRQSALGGVRRSLKLTTGHSLTGMALTAVTLLGGWLLAAPFQSIDQTLRDNGMGNPVVLGIVDASIAAVAAVVALATALIQVTAWRRLR